MTQTIIKYIKLISFIIFICLTFYFLRPFTAMTGIFGKTSIILGYILVFIPTLVIAKRKNVPIKIKLNLSSIGLSFILMVVFLCEYSIYMEKGVSSGISLSLSLVLMYIFVAAVEEVIFRGYLEHEFNFNKIGKAIILSLVFALIHHNPTLVAFLDRFTFSLLMYYLLYKTNNIMITILTHAAVIIVKITTLLPNNILYFSVIQYLILFAVAHIIFKFKAYYDNFQYTTSISEEKNK